MGWMIPMMVAASHKAEEEKLLAALVQQDTDHEFEYKILHGHLGAFRKPERLQSALEQESRAQWELAVTLDDQRIVLRRPHTARSRDVLLGTEANPYRTQIGGAISGRALAVLIGVVLLGAAIALLLGRRSAGMANGGFIAPSVLGVGVVTLLVLVVAIAAKR
jgi:hypothetical protein